MDQYKIDQLQKQINEAEEIIRLARKRQYEGEQRNKKTEAEKRADEYDLSNIRFETDNEMWNVLYKGSRLRFRSGKSMFRGAGHAKRALVYHIQRQVMREIDAERIADRLIEAGLIQIVQLENN